MADSGTAFDDVCHRLEQAIVGENSSASFACGGAIPTANTLAATDMMGGAQVANAQPVKPINIFWETKECLARKLILPLHAAGNCPSDTQIHHLVSDCEPAGFGRGRELVMDDQYRKASKLDPDRFATSFHPADHGIIHALEKILVPQLDISRQVKVELYKLNVYSGPSGLFRKHVDTPRSESQIGSLVVCLPSAFKGGALVVRHNHREVHFDWEDASADMIQWAAFYSDCEHEIKTISQGERITLTYNIYIQDSSDRIDSISLTLDPKMLPLYGDLENILQMPEFMAEGGILGIFCSHAYPHTSNHAREFFPRGLKGADLVVYTALHSFGIQVDVQPVMIEGGVQDCRRREGRTSIRRKFYGKVHVGAEMWPHQCAQNFCEEPVSRVIQENWPVKQYNKGITWITTPKHREAAMSTLTYGNEASVEVIYSYAAIIAVIPPWAERRTSLENRNPGAFHSRERPAQAA